MTGWPLVTLGAVAAPTDGAIAIGPFGSAMKAESYTRSGVRVIRGMNISSTRAWKDDWVFISDEFANSMPRCLAKPGDLVFPHRGSIGEVAIVPEDKLFRYFLSTSLMKITVDTSVVVPLFAYYFFRSPQGKAEILKYASQVGTPGIGQPLSSLRQFLFALPSLEEQMRISSMLAALDDKIDLNRRMNETLEAMARAVYKDWFVDFGPTRSKMEGKATYLASDLWALFPEKLSAEGGPSGWRPYRLDALAEYARAGISPSDRPSDVFEHYSLPAFDDGKAPVLDLGSSIKSNKFVVPGGSVLLSKLNPEIPRVWVPHQREGRQQVASTEFLVFVPKGVASRTFLYGVFTNSAFRRTLEGMVTGTSKSHQRVSPSAVMALDVVVAETKVIAAFDATVTPLLEQQLANMRETQTLVAMRNLLLPKLMSGEIGLKDAEKVVAAA